MSPTALASIDAIVQTEGPRQDEPAHTQDANASHWTVYHCATPPAEKCVAKHTTGGTKLYLAYGSNLAASTFTGRRAIKPLRAINVQAPDLQLVFDLPGLPYVEPCFANSRARPRPEGLQAPAPASILAQSLNERAAPADEERSLLDHGLGATHLGWHKGMVGVVYEVTDADFAHIIATEGGGASYADVEIDCFVLERGAKGVPAVPKGTPFKAHTLLADPTAGRARVASRAAGRRDGWAQPSARYLGLLTSGAAEHDLPADYREWLESLRPFTATTFRQKAGAATFVATWGPPFLAILGLQKATTGADGRAPKWVASLVDRLFKIMWHSYDSFYKKVFGEGERTIGDEYTV